jgi:hypothetical protein
MDGCRPLGIAAIDDHPVPLAIRPSHLRDPNEAGRHSALSTVRELRGECSQVHLRESITKVRPSGVSSSADKLLCAFNRQPSQHCYTCLTAVVFASLREMPDLHGTITSPGRFIASVLLWWMRACASRRAFITAKGCSGSVVTVPGKHCA